MKAVLRVALTTFTLVPLQRVLNAFGLLMLLVGAAFYVSAEAPNNAKALFAFMLVGVAVLLITPAFAGGVALRFASTRSLLHLQPHGRTCMLLGTTLAITILALLLALPWMWIEWHAAFEGRLPSTRHIPSLDLFMIGWAALSFLWVGLFIFSRSAATMPFVGLLPVLGMTLGRKFQSLFPGAEAVFALGLACWVVFAFWYLRTENVHRPDFPLGGEASMQPEASPLGRVAAWLSARNPQEPTQEAAMRQLLLGSPSYLMHWLTGLWIALLFIGLNLLSPGESNRRAASFLVVMPFLAFFTAAAGYNVARRTRYLWLRTGHDRAALFSLAEQMGLRASLTTWLVAAVLLGGMATLAPAVQWPVLGLFLLLQAVFAVLVFYGGLAAVRGWSVGEVLMCVALAVLIVAQLNLFGPGGAMSADVLAWALPPALLATVLMRAFAARRWRSLDWRVARMPRMTRT